MRLLINFADVDLTIAFTGMSEIINNPDHIVLTGPTTIDVNAFTICKTNSPLVIMKSYLLSSTVVYLIPKIEEDYNGKGSTSDL